MSPSDLATVPSPAGDGTVLPTRQQGGRQDSRARIIDAGTRLFCARGYFTVSVEDIAAAAGISRMTFYRHFSGKVVLAAEIFRESAGAATPRYLAIGRRDFHDRAVVADWIAGLFASDRQNRDMLRIFTEATAEASEFTERAQVLIAELIEGLGKSIPAFAIDRDDPRQRRRWLEAWLLLYELLDQSNHAAFASGIAADPLVIEILADRFLVFVGGDAASPTG